MDMKKRSPHARGLPRFCEENQEKMAEINMTDGLASRAAEKQKSRDRDEAQIAGGIVTDLAKLRAEARARYGTRCFWNVPRTASDRTLSERLRTYGDLAALALADAIDEASSLSESKEQKNATGR